MAILLGLLPYSSNRVIGSEPERTSLQVAVAAAPSVRAAGQRVFAAEQRLRAAGQWLDPSIEGMFSTKQMQSESMPMYELSMKQALPRKGERSSQKSMEAAALSQARAELYALAGELASDLSWALSEAENAKKRSELLENQLKQIDQAATALKTRLSTGGGALPEELALQARRSALQLQLEKEQVSRLDALDNARSLLGLGKEEALPFWAAPLPREIIPELSPALQQTHAKAEQARAMAAMARAEAKPMSSVGIRFERERASGWDNDTIGIGFMTEIPYWARKRSQSLTRSAGAELKASAMDREATLQRITSLQHRAERVIALSQATSRRSEETLCLLEAELRAFVLDAGTAKGAASILMFLELLERQYETQMQAIDAVAAAREARSQLWRHVSPNWLPISEHTSP